MQKEVENFMEINLQTRQQVEEIETSSKYSETENAIFSNADFFVHSPDGITVEPVSFVISEGVLITVRQSEFRTFAEAEKRLQINSRGYTTGYHLFVSILEIRIDADADAVEAELLTVNQQRTQVAATRDSYRRMLGVFIGRRLGGETLVCPDVAEPASFEPERPELALFDARIDKLAAQEAQVRSATRPRFGLFAQGYYGYPGLNYMQGMMSSDWSWNAMVGVKMSWNFGAYYTRGNSVRKLRVTQQQVEVQRAIFLFNTRLQTTEESGEIVRLRKALADDDRIVQLRRSVREAAEAKLRNGVIDTNDLLRKITDEATAATARSAREIELAKTICELKHTINR